MTTADVPPKDENGKEAVPWNSSTPAYDSPVIQGGIPTGWPTGDSPAGWSAGAIGEATGDTPAGWGSTGTGNGEVANYSFTGLIAPVLAGFSLPAIIVFASNTYPGQPSHSIILSLLVASTGLFMASIQLTSPLVDRQYKYAGSWRSGFTMLGICLIAVAIILLGEPAMHQWYGILALIVIFIGSIAPAVLLAKLWFQGHKPPGGATG